MAEVRLIDANALEQFYECGTDPDDSYADMTYIRAEHIENAPTIEPEKRGKWIPIEYDSYADGAPVWDTWECSRCGHEHKGEKDTLTVFCPDCGARMAQSTVTATSKEEQPMSKWDRQGECTECHRSCILDDGVLFCKRKQKVIDPDHVGVAGVCADFRLSETAMVNRYVTARKASRRAGVGYDCDLSRFRALPESVQEEIKRQLKGRVTD